MKHGLTILLLIVTGIGVSLAGNAAEDSAASECSTLSVQSSMPGIKVMVDTVLVGETPLKELEIVAGTHILHFVHPGANNWLLPAIVETIVARPSDRIERTVNFPTVFHVISDPYGAAVHYNDSLIGQTPLIFAASPRAGTGILLLSKAGYDDVLLPLPPEGGIVHTMMRASDGAGLSPLVDGEQVKSLTAVYVTTGAAVASGVVAAYFKIKADGRYDDYRATGDQGALDQVRKFDSISAIAVVTGEASLLMLSYFLLSR